MCYDKKRGDFVRNIPVFSTELGVASLVFDQIPYSGIAFVHIGDTACPGEFIDECAQFCRAAGGECVLATGHEALDEFPVSYEVLTMRRPLDGLADTDACLIPVTENTVGRWIEVYNERMKAVDGAAYMSSAEGKRLLEEGNGYFVHRNGTLLGIGKAAGETVDAVASVVPGAGETVFLALCHALSGPMVKLQVASTNQKAIHLYRKLELIATGVGQKWHRIF